MDAPQPRLVVRNHAPARRVLLLVVAAMLLLVALVVTFEWGQSRAGFDGAAARSERASLKDQNAKLEEELRADRLKIAVYETDTAGQSHERTELSKTIGELQAEVARLTSDVAFYRGMVEARTTGEVVKIQQFHVTTGKTAREFLLRLVLDRPLRPERSISGQAGITIEGTSADGSPASLDLSQLGVAGGALPFNLRYVQTLEQAVTLPQGFTPTRCTIELTPAGKGAKPVHEIFLWTVEN